jgi:hypothetical protein
MILKKNLINFLKNLKKNLKNLFKKILIYYFILYNINEF